MVPADEIDGADLRKLPHQRPDGAEVVLIRHEIAGQGDYVRLLLPHFFDQSAAEVRTVQIGKLNYFKAVEAVGALVGADPVFRYLRMLRAVPCRKRKARAQQREYRKRGEPCSFFAVFFQYCASQKICLPDCSTASPAAQLYY